MAPPTIRHYITQQHKAELTIAEAMRQLDEGVYEHYVGLDLETAPIEDLVDYPRGKDGDGWKFPATKRGYREFFLALTREHFDEEFLADSGIVLPTKLQGINATREWRVLYAAVTKLDNEHGHAELRGAYNVMGKLDIRLWIHVLRVVEESRISNDPIQPGLDPYTTDIALGQLTFRYKKTQQKVSFVYNAFKVDLKAWLPLLQRKKTVFMGANIKFDLKMLQHHIGYAPYYVWDTRVASRMLSLGIQRSNSLKDVAKRFLGIEMDKSVRDTFIGRRNTEFDPSQLEYAAWDTEVLFDLRDAINEEAAKRDQVRLIQDFSLWSLVVAQWELNGYSISQECWKARAEESIAKRDEAARKLERLLLGDDYHEKLALHGASKLDDPTFQVIKLTQKAVVRDLLSRELQMEVPSTGKDELQQLEAEYRHQNGGESHPFFGLWSVWVAFDTMVSRYGYSFLHYIHPLTGKIHPNINIAGTKTARLSGSDPNPFNMPRGDTGVDVRQCFVAPPGYDIGSADYSNYEMRAMAEVTGDETLKRVIESGLDTHGITAVLAFHLRRANVDAPSYVTEKQRFGSQEYEVRLLEVPANTSDAKYFEYASAPEQMSLLYGMDVDYGNLDENGKPKDKRPTRQLAKMVAFLKGYGGGPSTLAAKANITVRQARSVFAAYDATYSTLAVMSQKLGEQTLTTKFVTDVDGRVYGYANAAGNLWRLFELPFNPSRRSYDMTPEGQDEFEEAQRKFRNRRAAIIREAFNMYAQGNNAYAITRAMHKLMIRGAKYGILPYLSIYDELLVLVPHGVAFEDYARVIESSMREAAEEFLHTVPVEAAANPLASVWRKW